MRVSNVTLCHEVPNFLFLFINFRWSELFCCIAVIICLINPLEDLLVRSYGYPVLQLKKLVGFYWGATIFRPWGQPKVLTSSSLQTPNMQTDTPLVLYNSLTNVALTQYCRLPQKCHAHSVEYSLLCIMTFFVVMCDLHHLLHTAIRQNIYYGIVLWCSRPKCRKCANPKVHLLLLCSTL